jgi:hypothetical protein
MFGGHEMRHQYSELHFCFLYMGLKHGLSLTVFRDRVMVIFQHTMEVRGGCIMMSFTICAHHQILLG